MRGPHSCVCAIACSAVLALGSGSLVEIRDGASPVILSVPHGGGEPIPGATERRGEGARDFTVARDTRTMEIADRLALALGRELGGRPHVVAARFHRRYLDVNRRAADGAESDPARRVHAEYHRALERACESVRQRYGHGLLIDLHGQSADPGTIFLGTRRGRAVAGLIARRGNAAILGADGVGGALRALGYEVALEPEFEPGSQPRYTGGYVIESHGADADGGIDAIQVELGRDLRAPARMERTASDLAVAIGRFARAHLPRAPLPAAPATGRR